MKNKYNNMEFTLQYYKYDSMNTAAYMVVIDHKRGNHSYYKIPLDDEQRRNLCNIAVTKSKEEARAEVKRIFRRMIKQENTYKHYPFKLTNNEIAHLKGEYVSADVPIYIRLASAKQQKSKFESDNWIYTEPIKSGTIKVINGKFKIIEDDKRYTREIIKNSQFSQTVCKPSYWDNIRQQRNEQNEKK